MGAVKGVIIPLYCYPAYDTEETGPSVAGQVRGRKDRATSEVRGRGAWDLVISMKKRDPSLPIIAIVNPASGPGEGRDRNYTDAITSLTDADITVIGYLSTSYAGTAKVLGFPFRRVETIQEEIDLWYEHYPMISGFFFDEMARGFDQTVIAYYRQISNYAKGRGAACIVMNPGMPVNHYWYESCFADIYITWEKEFYPELMDAMSDKDYARPVKRCEGRVPQRGCLVMGTPFKRSIVRNRIRPFYDWFYITPKDLNPNPWSAIDGKTLELVCKHASR